MALSAKQIVDHINAHVGIPAFSIRHGNTPRRILNHRDEIKVSVAPNGDAHITFLSDAPSAATMAVLRALRLVGKNAFTFRRSDPLLQFGEKRGVTCVYAQPALQNAA